MSEIYDLSFAKIILIQADIAEVVVNEGVEMNLAMVEEYHDFLLSHLQAPFSLLINKINSYSYDFEAQMKLATLAEINVMAVVSYSRMTEISTNVLANKTYRETEWNLRIYDNREMALEWLISEQAKISEN